MHLEDHTSLMTGVTRHPHPIHAGAANPYETSIARRGTGARDDRDQRGPMPRRVAVLPGTGGLRVCCERRAKCDILLGLLLARRHRPPRLQLFRMVSAKRSARSKSESVRSWWVFEIWQGFRPYFIRLSVDFLIFAAFWTVLWAAHALTTHLPLGSTLSRFLVGFHETVVVLTFAWLSLEAVWDIVMLKRKG